MQQPTGEQRQDGTRQQARNVAPVEWEEQAERLARARRPAVVPGRPQTGTREPAGSWTEVAEPPERPPILTTEQYAPSGYPPYGHGHHGPPGYPPSHGGHEHPSPQQEPGGGDTGGHAGHEGPGPQPGPTPGDQLSALATQSRQNQANLTSAARAELHRRLQDYIRSAADPVGFHRQNGHVHGTPQFLPWHRRFLLEFETWQRHRLLHPSAFVPLAFWDPADPLPLEFEEPAPQPGFPPPQRNGAIPAMPLPASLSAGNLASLDYQAFASILEDHHNTAHGQVGGLLLDPRVSPADTCFWLLHAFYDNVFAQWEAARG